MSFRELSIDMQKSPKDHKDRMPFRIDVGPTRWEKRNILQLLPDWKPGNPIPSSFETRTAVQSRRDYYKDTAKILLRKHLGESMPAWIDKAGRRGLLKLAEEFKEDQVVQNILGTWKQQDEQVGKLVSMYLARSTKRLEYGQAQVAHDVCSYLHDKGVHRLIVETSFLAKVSQRHDNEDSEGLKRSQKYRQFAAVGKFVAVLKNTAIKYGIVVEELSAINTTRICQYCNHLNPGTGKEHFTCEKCERQIKQDHNAAVNISRFGCDPELAEMAASAG
jgi:transposase